MVQSVSILIMPDMPSAQKCEGAVITGAGMSALSSSSSIRSHVVHSKLYPLCIQGHEDRKKLGYTSKDYMKHAVI